MLVVNEKALRVGRTWEGSGRRCQDCVKRLSDGKRPILCVRILEDSSSPPRHLDLHTHCSNAFLIMFHADSGLI